MSNDATPAPAPVQNYRLIYNPTTKAVQSLLPVTCLVTLPKPLKQFLGTEAACQAQIVTLGLTPLPDPALAAAKTAKLEALASALNLALTAIFQNAPIQAQVTFSNLAGLKGSVTQLIDAGQLALAESALQGMLTDQLVPPGYSAFIDPAVAAIVAAAPNFAAVAAATTVAAVNAVAVP